MFSELFTCWYYRCKHSWLARKTHDQWFNLRTLAARLVEDSEIICQTFRPLSVVLFSGKYNTQKCSDYLYIGNKGMRK